MNIRPQYCYWTVSINGVVLIVENNTGIWVLGNEFSKLKSKLSSNQSFTLVTITAPPELYLPPHFIRFYFFPTQFYILCILFSSSLFNISKTEVTYLLGRQYHKLIDISITDKVRRCSLVKWDKFCATWHGPLD